MDIYKFAEYLIAFVALFAVVLFILIYIFNYTRFNNIKKSNAKPKLSIIIPAYNEEKCIGRCIESVLNSDYPANKLEIIVVDDGSTDNTAKVASSYKGVKVFTKKNEGTAAASKNYGIERATGEIIATSDADSYIDKDTISKMVPYFDEQGVAAVTSAIKISKEETFLQKLQRVEYLFMIFSRKVLSLIDGVFVTPGAFSMFKKDVLDKIGYFDEDNILEDQEIALRLQKHHYKIRSTLDACSYTDVPRNFTELMNQRIRWHRGGLRNSIKYFHLINPKYGNFGVAIMPLGVLAILFIFGILLLGITNLLFSLTNEQLFLDNLLLSFQPIHFIGVMIFLFTLSFTVYAVIYFKGEHVNPLWVILYIVAYAYLITFYWIVTIFKELKGEKLTW